MAIRTIKDIDLKNKKVIIREDFNVPISNGKVTSDARIRAALPTLRYALDCGAAVILLSHLGRPNEGEYQSEFSLEPVARCLEKLLEKPIKFSHNCLEGIDIKPGEIVLCENVRMQKGEKKNDPTLAKKMAALGDVFVMDAFATAHRAEASTVGIAQHIPAVAGLLLAKELETLSACLQHPRRPLVAIIGGSKVSTKLTVLENLLTKVNQMILGGGIANTFLAAIGSPIGKSLYEPDLISTAKKLLETAKQNHVEIILPVDVAVAKEFSEQANAEIKPIAKVDAGDLILDIGPKTAAIYSALLQSAGTILWNGPVGVFEFPAFEEGTKILALAIAESDAFSIAGGGDTLAAIEKFQIENKISYISTGGGAFLEFVEGKELPAIKILSK